MGRRHQEEENYWPGFVDALSTIVMVVTLLMIILVVVIFSISQMISKSVDDANNAGRPAAQDAQMQSQSQSEAQAQSEAQSQSEQKTGVQSQDQSSEVTQAVVIEAENTLQIQSRAVVDEQTIVVASQEAPDKAPEENRVKVESARQILTIVFENSGVELTGAARIEISAFLKENKSILEGMVLTTWSFYDPKSIALSQAKRRAYFRLLAVRNILIDNGFTGENLTVNVRAAPSDEEAGKVLVFVK